MVNSRAKGARCERELAAKLREMGFKNARRGQQFKGTPDSPDIADAIPGVHIESKAVEALNVHKALAQATEDAGQGEIPMVCHKKNRTRWLATIYLDDLLHLARWLNELETKR